MTYCNKLANTSGTELRSAQLADPRHLAKIQLQHEQRKGQPPARPTDIGYTTLVAAMHDLGDDVRLLIRAVTKSDLPFHDRPATPLDRIKDNQKQIGRNKIAELLGRGQEG